jgi:two-component system, NarL family, sensor histidine kinase UhpB
MDMTRFLMRRAVWISLACFCVVLVVAGVRARLDIRQEGQGADQMARLVGELAALQSVDGQALDAQVEKLREISRSGALRHLDFQLEDDAGQVLIPVALDASAAMAGQTRLQLRRADGSSFQATLISNPASEKAEALANIAGMAGLFFAYGLAMLAGLYWAVRYAFVPLRGIVGAIATYRKRDFSLRLPRLPVKELDHIAGALNHLATALAAAEAKKKRLSMQMLTLQEDERARLAIDLHEQFGQGLTALRANVAYLLRQTADKPQLHAVVLDLESQSASIHQGIRTLLRQLQPQGTAAGAEPETVCLQPLLHELLKSWQDVPGQHSTYRLEVEPVDLHLPRELSLTLYRMTQEALANIARHANAGRVKVALRLSTEQPGMLSWTVSDDGAGIAALESAICHGNGLAGIRERVWAHGGQIDIGPANDGQARPGLRLAALLPTGWEASR